MGDGTAIVHHLQIGGVDVARQPQNGQLGVGHFMHPIFADADFVGCFAHGQAHVVVGDEGIGP